MMYVFYPPGQVTRRTFPPLVIKQYFYYCVLIAKRGRDERLPLISSLPGMLFAMLEARSAVSIAREVRVASSMMKVAPGTILT